MPTRAQTGFRRSSVPTPAVLLALSLFASTFLSLRIGFLPSTLGLAAAAAAAFAVAAAAFPLASGLPDRSMALALLCLALGGGTAVARLWPFLPHFPNRPASAAAPGNRLPVGLPLSQVRGFQAVVVRDSSAAPGQAVRYELRLTRTLSAESARSADASADAVLWVRGGPRLAAGRLVEVEGGLSPPSPGQWPALRAAAAPEALTVAGYRNRFAALRADLLESARLRANRLDPAAAATLEALVLGSREELDTELYEGFRASGSLHLLALSGLHVGILYLLVRTLLGFCRRPGIRNLAAGAAVLAYLFLAGFRPSLFRAVVMILAGVTGSLLDRDVRPLNLLALAAVALILVEPAAVLGLSFQLSFLAVAGIVVLAPGLQRWLEKVLPRLAAAPLAYSLAAQAATAPLLLARFGVLHPIGVVAALPLIPIVSLFIWAALGYLLLGGTVLALPLASALGGLQRLLEGVVRLFAQVPPLFGAPAVGAAGVLLGALLLLRLHRPPETRPA